MKAYNLTERCLLYRYFITCLDEHPKKKKKEYFGTLLNFKCWKCFQNWLPSTSKLLHAMYIDCLISNAECDRSQIHMFLDTKQNLAYHASIPFMFIISIIIATIPIDTVTRIWNWSDCSALGHFVTQWYCLLELWNPLSFRMCSKASLTHRLWEIWNSLTQS